jgi:acyl-[acyl-carrier-protein]-phospholipid O-acyltransferase/long-chain-fatty-acid--[acyl-carrier-protein] ligase
LHFGPTSFTFFRGNNTPEDNTMQLHDRFVVIAKKYGSKLAIVDRTTNRKLTYSKALIGSLILQEKFKKYEEGFIGIMIPTSAGCALAMLGALMSGRIPVMINYSTGAASNAEFAQKKCDFKTIITSKALLEKINCPFMPGMVFIEDIMESVTVGDKLGAALRSKLPTFLLRSTIHQGNPDDILIMLFTSGSEKDPKAVPLTHKNIVTNINSLEKVLHLSDKDTFLANLPYFHVFGQTANMWAPLFFGMTIVTYANPLDFRIICDIVREERCTLMVGTPSFFWGYLNKSKPGDFESIRIMLSGADKCPDALRRGFQEKHGKVLLEAYGTTETSPGITVNSPEHNRPGSVGRVLPGVKVRLENYETGKECKTAEIGKILVKGDNVMKGYFDDFEETSMHIRHGWYDTGDMGWMDKDGYLWHVGRLRRFMKVGGEMISLIRVEDELEHNLPDGTLCCVVEIPDALRGAKIVAAVTKPIDERAVLKKMAAKLPNICLPKQFVVIEELPKMASGKIDFRSVTAMVRDLVHGQQPNPAPAEEST